MIDAVKLSNNSILPNFKQRKAYTDNKTSFFHDDVLPNTDTFDSDKNIPEKSSFGNTGEFIFGGIVLAGIIGLGFVFGKNKLQYLKKVKDIKRIDISTQLQKTADFNIFKDFKICENLSIPEKMSFHRILGDSCNCLDFEFYTTLMGKKAVGEIININGENIAYLNKLKLPEGIEMLRSYPKKGFDVNREYTISFVNKPELFKIFERNREIFTKRLGLDINADNEVIYSKIKDELRFKDVIVDKVPHDKLKHDLYGMCMGYPKYNTMIFQLESTGKIPYTLRKNPTEYKKQILTVLHGEKSPYKNLSKEEITRLEKAINNITVPNPLDRSPYEVYVEFTDEKDEFERIEIAAREFNEIFSVDKMINGIYS